MRAFANMHLCACALALSLSLAAFAQDPEPIVANQNRNPAGTLDSGVLNVKLEIREGTWHPEAEDGPALYVQAFGEAGHPAQIPGPMLRMVEGSKVHVTVTNKLNTKATVHGLNTRPGDSADALEIPAGETRERTFMPGVPGTYYYWARSTELSKKGFGAMPQPVYVDSQLNGAFIVDPSGEVPADRVFVINTMFVKPDVVQSGFEVVTINGKSYPFTERVEYTVGDNIHWRIINPGVSPHPMHLHGSFYKILSLGDAEKETEFAGEDRQSVVTENVHPGSTMLMEWSPSHAGRWLFHCHFQYHMSSDERVPLLTHAVPSRYDPPEAAAPMQHDDGGGMASMNEMAGLVLAINVKPKAGEVAATPAEVKPRKIDLIVEPNAQAAANEPRFNCAVREKNKVLVSEDRSVGPPIVVTRGELTEISVLNHLQTPTAIHWHGLELESYYDGVVGGGLGDQVTPAIAPGASFVARFTPTRAGTFIYHTHAADPNQLTGGMFGALIVLEPGQTFDQEHDKLLIIGSRDKDFGAKRITINGVEKPEALVFAHETTYRLRVINMAPNLLAEFRLGAEKHPMTWSAIAKDGADLPARLAKKGDAVLEIASGETYDFEFRAEDAGDVPLEIQNFYTNAKLTSNIVVR
jgi:FtsP/CotA-like multicopper oxidase with cupredoxin domain